MTTGAPLRIRSRVTAGRWILNRKTLTCPAGASSSPADVRRGCRGYCCERAEDRQSIVIKDPDDDAARAGAGELGFPFSESQ